jgi:hypothetical protein
VDEAPASLRLLSHGVTIDSATSRR